MSINEGGCTVTIGMPAYNSARFIKFAIQSVLNQTFQDFELIITDDGSTDETVAIARSFSDPRITVLTDGVNRGISYRLNQQIDLAHGRYFFRMDSDDIMFPDRLEKQVAYLDANSDVSIISSGMVIIDDDNNIIGSRPIAAVGNVDFTYEDWLAGKTLNHPTVAGRTEIFQKYHYDTTLCGVEDVYLWLLVSREHRVVIINDLFMFYRDPLCFKLATYLYRNRQKQRLLRMAAAKRLIPRSTAIKQSVTGYLKSMIARTMHIFGKSSLFIAHRNTPDKKLAEHLSILNAVIKRPYNQ